MAVRTRVTEMLGIEKPIIQAAMGWIARAQLSSAVSNAGGMGIIETSSGELDAVREEIKKMRTLTDKPFGVNVAQAFVRDPDIVQFIIDEGVRFVTTSAGDPQRYTGILKEAGLTVFHVVPSLSGALRAVEAGVDGLIVEGGEGGGFKNPKDVSSMVLIPQVCEAVDVPVVAAGGIMDGRTMAAALALGAEGVLMGTRILASTESPVHANWKDRIVEADATDTVFLNRSGPGPALRALRTERTSRLQETGSDNIFAEFADTQKVYFEGDLEAGIALTGQVAGRISDVRPVGEIFERTMAEFDEVRGRMSRLGEGTA
ncbi:nitronate monooxygenase [Pacificimonas flava]|uniref:Nitronate monooxygenase n=2 Tax=Pacificimonas TaxID=1960290 RepID=A0A219B3H8_9SPHN|nr:MULTISPECIES: nitronate monooxygenase [Pacificimonas]MBZ6377408.1 nitronate monooxygenase [Pacificimonas aurantium]OWV32887.1 nitronate monooxygenase [Pacificimonas flava]